MGLRVVVAMSGGVDSSLVCALLQEEGHEVFGVTMRPWSEDPGAWDAMLSRAGAVAEQIGIPHRVVDLGEEFRCRVVEGFVQSYLGGLTPNPCVVCNPAVKFGALWEAVQDLEPDCMATGHYVRRSYDRDSGRFQLHRGQDQAKDQSYVLWRMGQAQLARSLFPLGDLTKERVREMAAQRGMKVVGEQAESQEICFLFGQDYREFLARWAPGEITPGPVMDREGSVLGRHRGLPFYTVGQRRGLGISAAHPLYVVELDRARNALIVGPREALKVERAYLNDVNFIPFSHPKQPMQVEVQVRYNAHAVPAELRPHPERGVHLQFADPQEAVTPGQSAVCYRGDMLLGGGIIQRSRA